MANLEHATAEKFNQHDLNLKGLKERVDDNTKARLNSKRDKDSDKSPMPTLMRKQTSVNEIKEVDQKEIDQRFEKLEKSIGELQ